MGESDFGAPAGIYECRFEGIFPMNGAPRIGRDGKPMPPGVEWRFKILSAPFAGRTVGRITGEKPTAKNSCGAMLSGIAGHPLGTGQSFDPATMIGQVFQVVVGQSKENPEKTHVTQVFRSGATGASTGFHQPKPDEDAF
jgi:hypothetical protein